MYVAIVDHGLGNLFSVEQACRASGIRARITHDRGEIEAAAAVILPGVGAFGDAMATLRRLDLIGPLREAAAAGKPFIGICLGVQLLMSTSYEFGEHEGLGLIEGEVKPFVAPMEDGRALKVPQVGWNRIWPSDSADQPWGDGMLKGLTPGEFMYFLHSYVVVPKDPAVVVSTTAYGNVEFCSSLSAGSIFACQFHPERSGRHGLHVYQNLRKVLEGTNS